MIASLRGILMSIATDYCILEVHGVGYQIHMPLSALEQLRRQTGEVTVHTLQYVREDILALYGFLQPEEKELFSMIIGVSGIGPKTALALLSSLPGDRFRDAIRREDVRSLASAPGIGQKSAQRLVLELKSKLGKVVSTSAEYGDSKIVTNTSVDDTVAALTALGYPTGEVLRIVEEISNAQPNRPVGEMVREALKQLGKGI